MCSKAAACPGSWHAAHSWPQITGSTSLSVSMYTLFITFKKQGPDCGTQGLVKIAQPPRAVMLQWKCEISNQALPRKEEHYNLTSDSAHMRFSTARPGWSTSIPWRCWCHCWRLPPWTCSSSQKTKKNSWLQGTTRTKWRTFCICTPHQGEPLEANRLQVCRFPINPSDRFRTVLFSSLLYIPMSSSQGYISMSVNIQGMECQGNVCMLACLLVCMYVCMLHVCMFVCL